MRKHQLSGSGSRFYINRVPQPEGFTVPKVFKLVAYSLRQKWHHRKQPKCERPPSFLHYALIQYGGSGYSPPMVEDVQSLWKVTRALCLQLLPGYMIAYGATFQTFFFLQGLHMNVGLVKNQDIICPAPIVVKEMNDAVCKEKKAYTNCTIAESHMIPAATLTAFDDVSIILFLLVVGKILSFLRRRGVTITFKRRLIAGHAAFTLSLLAAALVEYFRLKQIWSCGFFQQKLGNSVYYAANMSIFYQIPQYVLMGISEVLVLVTSLEFVFTESPESMQGLMVGLFWFITGVGSFLSLPVVALVKLIPGVITADEINCNNEYFFMLILAGVVTIGAFVIVLAGKCKVL